MDYYTHSYYEGGKRKRNTLSSAYTNMKTRAKGRVDCLVCVEWKSSYKEFVTWALANGFKEGLTLCRNGDVGNYEPDNVRWDTQANNTIEAQARHYVFVHDGKEIEIYNLNQYCKDNNLNSSHMSKVWHGKLPAHKGYTRY